MRALLYKELRQILPLGAVLASLELVGLLEHFFGRSPDTRGWGELSLVTSPENFSSAAGLAMVLAFTAAQMLLPREHDERTIEFLYGLPVRRRTVFLAKVLTAMLVLAGFWLIDGLLTLWVQSFDDSSFGRTQFRLDLAALELGLLSGYSAICVAYGTLLSFTRRFAWILAVGLFSVVHAAAEISPALAILDVTALLKVEHRGLEAVIPWQGWTLHAVLGAGALWVAAWLWLWHGEAVERMRQRPGVRQLMRVLFWAALVVTLLVAIGVAAVLQRETEDSPSPARVSLNTAHFTFTYDATDREIAEAVAARADQAYEEVRQVLGARPTARVIADLTDESALHLGIAGWQKMRIDLGRSRDPAVWPHVLYHETAHVFIAAESDRRLPDKHESTFFFNEGLAEFVAHELLPLEASRRGLRRLGAAAVTRLQVRFDDLVDRASFVAHYDENLAYALGESWAAALVETCGPEAPGRVLRAFAAKDLPQDLAGRALWQEVLQRARCGLDEVNGRWALLLNRLKPQLASIPSASVRTLPREGGALRFEVQVSGAPRDREVQVIVRVRDDAKATPAQVRVAHADTTEHVAVLSLPADAVVAERFEVQVGVVFDEEARPYFGRWQGAD